MQKLKLGFGCFWAMWRIAFLQLTGEGRCSMTLGTVDALSHWADWLSEPSRKTGLAGGAQLSSDPLVLVSD
jgi:hypothetical protein